MEEDERAIEKMGGIKLEEEGPASDGVKLEPSDGSDLAATKVENAKSEDLEDQVKSHSENADNPSSSKPPTLSRKGSRKLVNREPPMFDHYPDATGEACEQFQVISDCIYGSKNLGSTDSDAFDCDCRDEWHEGVNIACGEDSDCINRATKVECSASGGNCSGGCQNQRFQRSQYADVSVIKTEKKGFGLRSNGELQANDFIFEYIGEVIGEPAFRRRMLQYDREGIKHFYFMSLNKNEFVDATKKGNLGRFCNHSCNPNCYVDKWVVGEKLRMGIFALRTIRPGEELVFNYNVDRYGADPQPCYCGEPNCVGFIGGKTQTGPATKLPIATVQALGIDAADGWDTTIAKKPRRKRADEDDEEYVNSIQPRPLDEEDARKVMAALMQCKEKWIAVKLLQRIQSCDSEKVIYCVMRMHAYPILKSTLNTFIDDRHIVAQILEILEGFPRMTRNKIQDSKIETTVQTLANSEDEDIATRSQSLLEEWGKLEMGFRIKRRKIDPNAPKLDSRDERRAGAQRDEEAKQSPKKASPKPIDAPKGPKSSVPQRNGALHPIRPRRPFNAPLPEGWFTARDAGGNVYFYNKQGATTWRRPTQPAIAPVPKGPSKAAQEQALIQSIINRVTKEGPPKSATPAQSVQSADTHSPAREEKTKKDKWRSLPVDKQMKLYENTIFPPVKHVLDKFKGKLPKDDLKRLGKDIAKKLVASDYKNNRVTDPTAKLTEKQVGKIKKYVKDFLERAVEKYDQHQDRKATKNGNAASAVISAAAGPASASASNTPADSPVVKDTAEGEEEDITLSDVDEVQTPSGGGAAGHDRKRKHDELAAVSAAAGASTAEAADPTESSAMPDVKRLRGATDHDDAEDNDELANHDGEPAQPAAAEEVEGLGSPSSSSSPPPPPPPPPPPDETSLEEAVSEERRELREQEEALMRENEEAQRLEDEASRTKEMEDKTRSMQQEMAWAAS